MSKTMYARALIYAFSVAFTSALSMLVSRNYMWASSSSSESAAAMTRPVRSVSSKS